MIANQNYYFIATGTNADAVHTVSTSTTLSYIDGVSSLDGFAFTNKSGSSAFQGTGSLGAFEAFNHLSTNNNDTMYLTIDGVQYDGVITAYSFTAVPELGNAALWVGVVVVGAAVASRRFSLDRSP